MKIYTIDNDGYISGIKNVGDKYIMNPNDIEGEAPFFINHHHKTGLERPLTQEQFNQQRIQELKTTIPDREMIKDILTQEELTQLTTDKMELKTLLGY